MDQFSNSPSQVSSDTAPKAVLTWSHGLHEPPVITPITETYEEEMSVCELLRKVLSQ